MTEKRTNATTRARAAAPPIAPPTIAPVFLLRDGFGKVLGVADEMLGVAGEVLGIAADVLLGVVDLVPDAVGVFDTRAVLDEGCVSGGSQKSMLK